jgi:hypothetical protein
MAGEYIVDTYRLPIADGALAGQYAIEIGMYDAATGKRLPVRDALDREVRERRVLLDQRIRVVAR